MRSTLRKRTVEPPICSESSKPWSLARTEARVRRRFRRRSCASRLSVEQTADEYQLDHMAYLVGALLALLVGALATLVHLDRDRAFYPTVLIVVASYYALFAVMADSTHALLEEGVGICVFLAAAVVGFKRSLWLVVLGLAAHGVFDLLHARVITNPGVPGWWPPFCSAYDVVAAGYLASLLGRRAAPEAGASV